MRSLALPARELSANSSFDATIGFRVTIFTVASLSH